MHKLVVLKEARNQKRPPETVLSLCYVKWHTVCERKRLCEEAYSACQVLPEKKQDRAASLEYVLELVGGGPDEESCKRYPAHV